MLIDNKFDIGQIVYLRTDVDQVPRIVVKFEVTSSTVLYILASGEKETTHYDIEISETKDVVLKTSE
jgi:hypothetical protein